MQISFDPLTETTLARKLARIAVLAGFKPELLEVRAAPKRIEIAVLVGRHSEFSDFMRTRIEPGLKVIEATLTAVTDHTIYRGFCRPESVQGYSPTRVITFGSFQQRFSEQDVNELLLAALVEIKNGQQSDIERTMSGHKSLFQ